MSTRITVPNGSLPGGVEIRKKAVSVPGMIGKNHTKSTQTTHFLGGWKRFSEMNRKGYRFAWTGFTMVNFDLGDIPQRFSVNEHPDDNAERIGGGIPLDGECPAAATERGQSFPYRNCGGLSL